MSCPFCLAGLVFSLEFKFAIEYCVQLNLGHQFFFKLAGEDITFLFKSFLILLLLVTLALPACAQENVFPGKGSVADWQRSQNEYENGHRYKHKKKWESAVDAFQRAINIYPYDDLYYSSRATCFRKLGENLDATQDCARALAIKNDPTYWMMIADISADTGDFMRCRKAINSAQACGGTNAQLLYENVVPGLIKTCKEHGQAWPTTKEKLTLAEMGLDSLGATTEDQFNKQIKRLSKTQLDYARGSKKRLQNLPTTKQTDDAASAMSALGVLTYYAPDGTFTLATNNRTLIKARSFPGKGDRNSWTNAEISFRNGMNIFARGQQAAGLELLQKANSLYPNDEIFLLNLGTAFYYEKNIDASIINFQKATVLSPNDFRTWRNLAVAFLSKDRRKDAAAAMMKAATSAPKGETKTILFENSKFLQSAKPIIQDSLSQPAMQVCWSI